MESQLKFHPNPNLKLMDQVQEVLRYHHYAYRTEQTYCQWILRYIRFFGGQIHPRDLGTLDVQKFLSDLVIKRKVAASTQHQALNALVFLYRDVLDLPLDGKIQPVRSKKKPKLPTVIGKEEITRFFHYIDRSPLRIGKTSPCHGIRPAESREKSSAQSRD